MSRSRPLGGVDLEEIRAIAVDPNALSTEAGASLTTRFSRRVCDLIVARSSKAEGNQFSVFLRSEALSEDISRCGHTERPLIANGADEISGRIWIATANFGCAFELDLTQPWNDQTSLFRAIRSQGFGALPALVVDWRGTEPLVRLYEKGIDKADDSQAIVLTGVLTPPQMKGILDRFFERSLRTPALTIEGKAARIWRDARKGIPEARPEEVIQGRLLDVLKATLTRFEVRAEPVTPDGRADIVVFSYAALGNGQPAIVNNWLLELKALCDMTRNAKAIAPGKISAAIVSGFDQVLAYRRRLVALEAALCCYDMRKTDCGDTVCFKAISAPAQTQNFHLWRWFLFRTTRRSRDVANAVAQR